MNSKTPPTTCSILVLLLSLACSAEAEELRAVVLFKLSGPVAEKLPGDTVLRIHAAGKKSFLMRRVDKMPLSASWEYFLRSGEGKDIPVGGFVDFRGKDGKRVFGVLLSSNLFDKPRTVNLVLKRPETFVKPADIFFQFGFRYHAMLSKRMQYTDVPRWDARKERFLAPVEPMLRVYDIAKEELILESEMRSMCYGHGWVLMPDFPTELPDKTKLRVEVTHDTGDLFGELKTECSFTYDKKKPD